MSDLKKSEYFSSLTKRELYSLVILHGLVVSDLTKPGGPPIPMEQYVRSAVYTADKLVGELKNK
jgi:hypothetical protein